MCVCVCVCGLCDRDYCVIAGIRHIYIYILFSVCFVIMLFGANVVGVRSSALSATMIKHLVIPNGASGIFRHKIQIGKQNLEFLWNCYFASNIKCVPHLVKHAISNVFFCVWQNVYRS